MISQISFNENSFAGVSDRSSTVQRHQDMFAKLDKNGDQTIDVVELQAGAPADGQGKDAATILKEADTSGDGTIDASENENFLSKLESSGKPSGPKPSGPPPGGAPPRGATGGSKESEDQVYDARDTNRDGVVSLQELLAAEDKDAASMGAKTRLTSLAAGTPEYDEKGSGIINAAGQVIDTAA